MKVDLTILVIKINEKQKKMFQQTEIHFLIFWLFKIKLYFKKK